MADEHGLLARWKLVQLASTDARLSRGDVAVLIAILDRLNTDGVAWPGLSLVATEACVDRSSAVRCVKRLVTHNYLLRQSGNRTASNRYHMGSPIRCASTPRRRAASRCDYAPSVGADSYKEVDATLHLESTYKNLPSEPAQPGATDTANASRPADLWADGVRLLTESGTSREQAGHVIGKLRKVVGEDEAFKVVTQMLAIRPTGPRSYLFGVIQARAKQAVNGRVFRDSRSEDEILAANLAALARLEARA